MNREAWARFAHRCKAYGMSNSALGEIALMLERMENEGAGTLDDLMIPTYRQTLPPPGNDEPIIANPSEPMRREGGDG